MDFLGSSAISCEKITRILDLAYRSMKQCLLAFDNPPNILITIPGQVVRPRSWSLGLLQCRGIGAVTHSIMVNNHPSTPCTFSERCPSAPRAAAVYPLVRYLRHRTAVSALKLTTHCSPSEHHQLYILVILYPILHCRVSPRAMHLEDLGTSVYLAGPSLTTKNVSLLARSCLTFKSSFCFLLAPAHVPWITEHCGKSIAIAIMSGV